MPTNQQPVYPSSRPPIRCLLFDLGYTLWDRRRDRHAGTRAEAEANCRTGAFLRQQYLSEQTGSGDDEQAGAVFRARFDDAEHEFLRRHSGLEPDGPQLVRETLRHWGIKDADHDIAETIFHALRIHIAAPSFLFEDTIPTLATLQARGYHLGVVTNRLWGGSDFLADLRQIGLLRYFDTRAIAISADVGVRKPHPDLYLQTCRALGLAPTETAMVGDSLRTDILGAQCLDMFTVWKPRPKQWEHIRAHEALSHSVAVSQPPTPMHPVPPRAVSDTAAGHDQADGDTDYVPASKQGRDGYLERYLRGEIRPDLVIEHVADLLAVFVDAQAPLHY
ncbi:MAG: HAD family hydrolase [Ktedonobacteraceae bacterium]|nr:HAD family hydrolase [Ktedonobacteraceae bacterium]